MRVFIPTADYPPIEGGISSVALHVSRELSRMGHEVTVLAPYFPGMDAFDEAEPARVVRYRGYGWGWLRLLPILLYGWRAARRADVLIAINVAYGGLLGLLTPRTPMLVFAYAYEFLKFGRAPLLGALLRRVYARARAIVAISNFTRDQLAAFGVPQERISVAYPGAPTSVEFTEDELGAVRRRHGLERARVILAVGRFIPRKNHLALIEALPTVLESVPDALLVLVGQGPMRDAVERRAKELGVRPRVVLTGRLEDREVAALYALCDVFALPTGTDARGQVEGFGLVFSEAHAYGKPVVAGRSGGVVDAVIDGETGLFVEANDAQALAEALVRVLKDPDLARHLGENGKRRVETELNWAEFTRRSLAALEKTR